MCSPCSRKCSPGRWTPASSSGRARPDCWICACIICAIIRTTTTKRWMTGPSGAGREWCSNASRFLRLWKRSPAGRLFRQAVARELAACPALLFICGAYEGVDERICQEWVDDELSIGDYVLTNGTLAAMVVIDAVTRLLPGALGDEQSVVDESFSRGLLEYPHYTRPADFRGMKVPPVLLSGNHAAIDKWRREQALARTAQRRPDLAGKDQIL